MLQSVPRKASSSGRFVLLAMADDLGKFVSSLTSQLSTVEIETAAPTQSRQNARNLDFIKRLSFGEGISKRLCFLSQHIFQAYQFIAHSCLEASSHLVTPLSPDFAQEHF